jgi:hypothetical protein
LILPANLFSLKKKEVNCQNKLGQLKMIAKDGKMLMALIQIKT